MPVVVGPLLTATAGPAASIEDVPILAVDSAEDDEERVGSGTGDDHELLDPLFDKITAFRVLIYQSSEVVQCGRRK